MAERPLGFFPKDVERIRRAVRAHERDGGEPVGGQSITRKPRGGSTGGWAKLVGNLEYGKKAMAQPAKGIKGNGVTGDLHEFEFDTSPAAQIEVIEPKLLPSGKKFASGAIVHWVSEYGKKVVDFSSVCQTNI